MTGLTIPFTGLKKQYNNLRDEILAATDEVLRSGQLMNGNYTAEFEDWLAKKNHTKYAITCHSGTQALEIISQYHAQNAHTKSPVVLLPAMTYVATANAFIRAGWSIRILDTDAYGIIATDNKQLRDPAHAVVLVGLYGAAQTRDAYWKGEARILIEDAAQHWLANNCTRVGCAAISFDPMKNLSCYGNGGAVVTDDLYLAEYARSWRDNGKPTHADTGTNSRMSEIDCAQMMVKIKYIDTWQSQRKEIVHYWIEQFEKVSIRSLIDSTNFARHCYHKFVIDIDNRDIVKQQLANSKIETRIHYAQPLHELPAYADLPGPGFFSKASALSRRVLSLPLYPELTDLEVEYVADHVIRYTKL